MYSQVKVSIVDEDDKYTGGDTTTLLFNVWEGIRELLAENAYVLGYVVLGWSGIWPYLKLVILGVGLVVYRSQRLPRSFEWLSHIAHFSFLDVWMVAIAGVALRFYYKDEEEKVGVAMLCACLARASRDPTCMPLCAPIRAPAAGPLGPPSNSPSSPHATTSLLFLAV